MPLCSPKGGGHYDPLGAMGTYHLFQMKGSLGMNAVRATVAGTGSLPLTSQLRAIFRPDTKCLIFVSVSGLVFSELLSKFVFLLSK